MTRLLLAAAATLLVAAAAPAQDPVGRRPAGPALPAQLVLKGYETLHGRTTPLEFTVDTKTTTVERLDELYQPTHGTVESPGRDRLTLRFNDRVYDGTVGALGSFSGAARFTAGPNAGKTWTFEVRVR